jgi:hypothetical protein
VITKIVCIVSEYTIHCKTQDFCHENYIRKEASKQISKAVAHYFIFFEINITSTAEQILKNRFPVKEHL